MKSLSELWVADSSFIIIWAEPLPFIAARYASIHH